jgi:ureidoglycolate dehydrogenase (NAD+)
MPQISSQSVRVDAKSLEVFARNVLMHRGVPALEADYVAWHLVETNLRGTDSHGVARLPHYVRRLEAGSIRTQPTVRFERKAFSVGILDGDHGLGHLIMRRAADEAAAIARETGAAWVSVRNSSHCGALAPIGLHLAEEGMVGFVFTHVDPMVLPHGALEPFCGTNPICITAPGADGKTLCLDMATSIVPWNVVANAKAEGISIPSGWAVDEAGQDTTDPRVVKALYPLGEYKGSGLGILIDVLCAALSGAPYGPDIPKMYGDMHAHRRLGGLVGALRIDAFTGLAAFAERVAQMAMRIGQLKPAAGVTRVLYPGESELAMKAVRQIVGIPVGVHVFAALNELARAANLASLEAIPSATVHAEA